MQFCNLNQYDDNFGGPIIQAILNDGTVNMSDYSTPASYLDAANDYFRAQLIRRSLNGEFNIEKHVQTPAFIPQSTSVLKALEILKSSKVHMAFLVDEFGAFEGVVTATDLLEMIAGDFNEGHDEGEQLIRQREDGTWLVDGQMDLDELADELGEDFGENEGFHTIAGLVLHQLSRVPQEGEVLQLGRFEVEVIDMDDRRIDKLLFKQVVKPEDEAEANAARFED